MKPINLASKLSLFDSHWDPKIVATYNDNDVMVVKFVGEFPYHKHDSTDDFFLVLSGEVTMDFRASDGATDPETAESQTFGPGELLIVPAGQVHRPRAESEACVLLIEPTGEPNTGDADVTAAAKDRI